MSCDYCGRDDCDLMEMSKSKLLLDTNEEVIDLTMSSLDPADLSGLPSREPACDVDCEHDQGRCSQ